MNHVTVGSPWTCVSCQASAEVCCSLRPRPWRGRGVIQSRQGDAAELVVGITMPPGADDADVTVPGPTWILEQPVPAIVWAAGVSGVVDTRTACDLSLIHI